MPADAAALVRTWQVGRWTATLTVPPVAAGVVRSAVIEWSPEVPRNLTPEQVQLYREGRDQALAALGLRALVIEL